MYIYILIEVLFCIHWEIFTLTNYSPAIEHWKGDIIMHARHNETSTKFIHSGLMKYI